MAAVCVATAGVGLAVSPEWQMATLLAVLIAGIVADGRVLAHAGA
jgi:hypothetical protein